MVIDSNLQRRSGHCRLTLRSNMGSWHYDFPYSA
jgi:hypothetical protein